MMMRILIDTHIALWALVQPDKLDSQVREMLENEGNDVYFSVASVWEIAIKHKIHPEQMPLSEEDFVDLCIKTGFKRLDINVHHIYEIKNLSRPETAKPHNDPFDRLLISQAKIENITFITHDALLSDYNESCIMNV